MIHMFEHFQFAKLSKRHKNLFRLHQFLLFASIGGLTYAGISVTNPEITTVSDQMSLTTGAIVGMIVGFMAYTNRLKGLMKVKFLMFAVLWFLLYSLQTVLPTLIWTTGLIVAPLAIDDLILLPIWKNVWYNQYEQ